MRKKEVKRRARHTLTHGHTLDILLKVQILTREQFAFALFLQEVLPSYTIFLGGFIQKVRFHIEQY
jgi:hypothetical protein